MTESSQLLFEGNLFFKFTTANKAHARHGTNVTLTQDSNVKKDTCSKKFFAVFVIVAMLKTNKQQATDTEKL